jgi:hypothetical protein
MKWILLTTDTLPKKKGDYMCFVPECKHYKEHHSEYYWNGEHFIDTQFLVGRDRIVTVSHYFKISKPRLWKSKS